MTQVNNNPTLEKKVWMFDEGTLVERSIEEILDEKKFHYADAKAVDFGYYKEEGGGYVIFYQKRGGRKVEHPSFPRYDSEDKVRNAFYEEIESWGVYPQYEPVYFDTREEAIADFIHMMDSLSNTIYALHLLEGNVKKLHEIFLEVHKTSLGKGCMSIFEFLNNCEDLADYADEAKPLFDELGITYDEDNEELVIEDKAKNHAAHFAYSKTVGTANTLSKIENSIKHIERVEHDVDAFASGGMRHPKKAWAGKQWVVVDKYGVIRAAMPFAAHREHIESWEEFRSREKAKLAEHGKVYTINNASCDPRYTIWHFTEKDREQLFPEKLAAIEEYKAQMEAIKSL